MWALLALIIKKSEGLLVRPYTPIRKYNTRNVFSTLRSIISWTGLRIKTRVGHALTTSRLFLAKRTPVQKLLNEICFSLLELFYTIIHHLTKSVVLNLKAGGIYLSNAYKLPYCHINVNWMLLKFRPSLNLYNRQVSRQLGGQCRHTWVDRYFCTL